MYSIYHLSVMICYGLCGSRTVQKPTWGGEVEELQVEARTAPMQSASPAFSPARRYEE
jgi:hypothetical protein